MKLALVLCLSVLMIACGGTTNLTPTAQAAQSVQGSQPMTNLFPLKDGTKWQFRNPATGATFTISWSRFNGSFCGDGGHPLYLSTWTKSDRANYWMPGADVIQYQLYYDDGTWVRSNGWWSDERGRWFVQNMIQAGPEAPYPIMLDDFTAPGSIDAPYVQRGAYHRPQLDCLPASDDMQVVPWTTKFYQSTVNTPFYSGRVIVSEQIEGCNPGSSLCNHELWSFAPNLGLVEIQDLSGYGIRPGGAPIVNVRIK